MSSARFFHRALGAPLTPSGMAAEVAPSFADHEIPLGSRPTKLPEYWKGTAVVVLLSLLVLQAARWSIYLQPQYYLIKPAVVLGCWALFIVAWKWRLGRMDMTGDAAMSAARHQFSNLVVGIAGGAVLLAGPVVEWLNRRFQAGDPPEFLAFDAVLAAAMLLTVAQSRRRRQTALIGSAFAALLVTFAKPDPAVYALAILFGVVGLWRMMTTYWEGIESKAVGSTSRRVPFRFSILGLTTMFVLLMALAATAIKREAWGWTSRWSLFSGGDQWSDPYATAGVGDGENLVAATKSAQSEGPIDSDMFIESKQRSLYDVISEMYGDQKPTPRKETSQAVGVRTENYLHHHGRLAKVEQNTTSFQTSRTTQGQPRPQPADVLSEALLLVTGQAPTHLAIETFDLFDGETWFQSADNPRRTMVGVLPGEDNEWFCFKRGDSRGIFHGLKTYQVAFLHLKSDRIPLPPLTEAWSIGHVKQARFYRPTPDDGLQMTLGNSIPEFTVVRLVSRGFRWRALPVTDFWRQVRVPRPTQSDDAGNPVPAPETELELPADDELTAQLQQIATTWTRTAPPGWAKVTAIVAGLREQFQHEPLEEPSLAKFLTEKRGPDYLFATAAVLMLRTQGIPARLVTGFYLAPENYDRKTGKTAVLPQDAHFWVEVHAGDGNWIPIEPTPGYQPTPESLTLLDRLVQGLMWALAGTVAHWPWALLLAIALAFAVAFRNRLWDRLAWWRWRTRLWLRPQSAVLSTLQFLERWAAKRGAPRAAHQPVDGWLARVVPTVALPGAALPTQAVPHTSLAVDSLTGFRNLLQQQSYGPLPLSAEEVRVAPAICRQVVIDLTTIRSRSTVGR